MNLVEEDDYFHPPASEERWWTETYWFSFDDPIRHISGTFYPLVRPNLDIAALTVAIWAPGQSTAWSAPYYRGHWHLKPPAFAGNHMEFEGLCYEVLEPLNRYRVKYEDSGTFSADLDVVGVSENHVLASGPERGHWDQPTRVRGWLNFQGEQIEIDCFGMRDRSWGPRFDDASARATYVYGINANASFLVVTQLTGAKVNSQGYLEQSGKRGRIVSAEVLAERDENHRVTTVKIIANDDLGRELKVTGFPRNHIAKQASPGYFAWMSLIEWDFHGTAYGEFQDVWSPDRLSKINSSNSRIRI